MSEVINLNDSSPAAASGFINASFQKGATTGNDPNTGFPVYPVSAEVPIATTSQLGVVKPDGATITIAGGVISAAGGGGGGWTPYPALSQPLVAGFTQVNFGSGTAADKTERMAVQTPNHTGNLYALVSTTALPAAPYTIDLAVSTQSQSPSSDHLIPGILLTDGTLYRVGGPDAGQSSPNEFVLMSWNSPSSFSSFPQQELIIPAWGLIFVRITDDGTTRSYFYSNNGRDFFLVATEASNTWVTPTSAGIGFYSSGVTNSATFSLFNWAVTNSILPAIGA